MVKIIKFASLIQLETVNTNMFGNVCNFFKKRKKTKNDNTLESAGICSQVCNLNLKYKNM